MILNPKDGSRYESCVRRIRASWEARGVPEGRAVAIAEHHVASVADMNRVVSAAQRASDKLGSIKLKDRRHLANMVRKLYGTSRRVTEEDWPMAFAAVAERYVGEGVDRASVLARA